MRRLAQAAVSFICLFAASEAAAADLLPLKRGIYVDVNVPCKGASNADTLSYWGGNNGINEAKVRCTVKRAAKKNAVYALQRSCKSIDFNGTFEDGVNVKVLNRSSFILSGGHHLGAHDRTYRYCGPKVQF